MDPTPWIEFQQTHKVAIIGSFENVHGERFVIWRNENGDTPYITGDEFAWEPKNRLWPSQFVFNDSERAQIAKILWFTTADLSPEGAKVPVTYSPELEKQPGTIEMRKQLNIPALLWDAREPVGG
jgi:hypothetical protein